MRGVLIAAASVILLSSSPSFGQAAKLIKKFSSWSAYEHSSASNKVCFVISKPSSKKPTNVKRGPIFFYVSHYPNDGVRNEISIKIGYPFRDGVTATLNIGGKKFTLFTKDEGAFVKESAVEQDIVAAMKKGSRMTVQGRSKRGTLTTDTYSLKGVTAALDAIGNACP